jgi:hypothetical protein
MWKRTGKSLALSAALLLTAPVGMAQNEKEFSDEELAKYAQARAEILEVSKSYRSDMQNAENEQEAQKLRKELQDEMMGVVKDAGMSVKEYNKMTKAVRQDEKLRKKVQNMQGGGSSGGQQSSGES